MRNSGYMSKVTAAVTQGVEHIMNDHRAFNNETQTNSKQENQNMHTIHRSTKS